MKINENFIEEIMTLDIWRLSFMLVKGSKSIAV